MSTTTSTTSTRAIRDYFTADPGRQHDPDVREGRGRRLVNATAVEVPGDVPGWVRTLLAEGVHPFIEIAGAWGDPAEALAYAETYARAHRPVRPDHVWGAMVHDVHTGERWFIPTDA